MKNIIIGGFVILLLVGGMLYVKGRKSIPSEDVDTLIQEEENLTNPDDFSATSLDDGEEVDEASSDIEQELNAIEKELQGLKDSDFDSSDL